MPALEIERISRHRVGQQVVRKGSAGRSVYRGVDAHPCSLLSLQAAETAGSTLTPTGGAPAAEFTAGSTLTPTSGAPAAEFMPVELATERRPRW